MTSILGGIISQSSGNMALLLDAALADSYVQGNVERVNVDTNIAFAATNGAHRAVIFKNELSMLAIYGTLFLPSGNVLANDELFANEFIPGFSADADGFLRRCDGAFVLAFADLRSKDLILASDPFGNLPLYYSILPNGVLFSTRQRPLARAVAAALDENAVLQYIGIGFTVGDNTYYKNIKRLWPGSILRFNDRADIRRYSLPSFSYVASADIPTVLEKLSDELVASVSDKLVQAGRSCTAITGGLDSRTIMAALHRAGKTSETTFYTHGEPSSYDMTIAEDITSSLGLSHVSLPFDSRLFSECIQYFDTVVDTFEGVFGLDAAPMIMAWQWQRERFDSVLDGHGGQIYRRQILKARLKSIERGGSLASGIVKYISSPLIHSEFLRADTASAVHDASLRELQDYCNSLPEHLPTGDKIDRFFIDQICNNKHAHGGNVEMSYVRMVHPLLTVKAVELLSTLPIEFRSKNKVYLHLIKTLYPELTKFPIESAGYRAGYHGYVWKRYIPILLDWYLKPISKRFAPRRLITSVDMVMKYGRPKAEGLLSENIHRIKNYVDDERLLTNMKTLSNGDLAAFTSLALLMRYLSER